MTCDHCGERPANFHITTIANGERQERNLCPECMAKMKTQMPGIDFSNLTGLLSGFLEAVKANEEKVDEPDVKCSKCGMTYQTFKKIGLLGCAHCYKDFKEPLSGLLNRVHGHLQHVGRAPKGSEGSASIQYNVERLRQSLSEAISNEEYEAAAGLRDQIRALTAQLTELGPEGDAQ